MFLLTRRFRNICVIIVAWTLPLFAGSIWISSYYHMDMVGWQQDATSLTNDGEEIWKLHVYYFQAIRGTIVFAIRNGFLKESEPPWRSHELPRQGIFLSHHSYDGLLMQVPY
jgi:hypothetical protein